MKRTLPNLLALAIVYVGGVRRIQLQSRGEDGAVLSQAEGGLQVVKVNPRVRTQSIDATIPSIPIESILTCWSAP